jgi:hypothetical protein
MGMIEAPFGDLVLGIMQNPYVRWPTALAVALGVWGVGDEDARFRRFYLAAPLGLAIVIQLIDSLFLGSATGKSGQGGWFEHYLSAMEALRRLASVIGVGAMIAAIIFGFTRMLGGTLLLTLLLAAYFADQMMPQAKSFFSGPVFAQVLALLPAVILVLLTAYGVGATLRHLRERYND